MKISFLIHSLSLLWSSLLSFYFNWSCCLLTLLQQCSWSKDLTFICFWKGKLLFFTWTVKSLLIMYPYRSWTSNIEFILINYSLFNMSLQLGFEGLFNYCGSTRPSSMHYTVQQSMRWYNHIWEKFCFLITICTLYQPHFSVYHSSKIRLTQNLRAQSHTVCSVWRKARITVRIKTSKLWVWKA